MLNSYKLWHSSGSKLCYACSTANVSIHTKN